MKVVIQRCKYASVKVNNKLINKIDEGYLILVGFTFGDNEEVVEKIVKKVINLRIFADEDNKINKSIKDINGSILSISQFTLYADTKKGNRPSFKDALESSEANKLYNYFNSQLNMHVPTYSGIFQEDMQIELLNDGPLTIVLD